MGYGKGFIGSLLENLALRSSQEIPTDANMPPIERLIKNGAIAFSKTRSSNNGDDCIEGEEYAHWLAEVSYFFSVNFPNSRESERIYVLTDKANGGSWNYYDQIIGILKAVQNMPTNAKKGISNKGTKQIVNDSIFIGHGHAELLKLQMKDFVREKLGKKAVILSDEPNNGMTVVEKLEAVSERCNKAIILLTKDDEMADGTMRGRQNVIHEIGFFQGKYGRKNVILLQEEGVESFTNISGIVYIQFNRDHFSEVFEQLRNELL